MKKLIYLILVLGVLANVCFAAETAAKGRITEVTVYRGQALITRQVPIELAAGNHEIVVSSLPHKIISDSLYAYAADDISVLSVRYRERAEKEDTREEVKELDRQIDRMHRTTLICISKLLFACPKRLRTPCLRIDSSYFKNFSSDDLWDPAR